jgi:hypothetical protein
MDTWVDADGAASSSLRGVVASPIQGSPIHVPTIVVRLGGPQRQGRLELWSPLAGARRYDA